MDTPQVILLFAFLPFVLLAVFSFLVLVTLHCQEVAQGHTFHFVRTGCPMYTMLFFSNNRIQHSTTTRQLHRASAML